jgi:hypothetical protein
VRSALRLLLVVVVEQSSLDGFYLDPEAFSLAVLDSHGGKVAVLDLVQHGLTGQPERRSGVGER